MNFNRNIKVTLLTIHKSTKHSHFMIPDHGTKPLKTLMFAQNARVIMKKTFQPPRESLQVFFHDNYNVCLRKFQNNNV
jgi:hypothetical protein